MKHDIISVREPPAMLGLSREALKSSEAQAEEKQEMETRLVREE